MKNFTRTYLFALLLPVCPGINTSFMSGDSTILFDFKKGTELSDWYIVDDVVMGGRSDGSIQMNEEGHGVFSGMISLENNGGFSSVRYGFSPVFVQPDRSIGIRLKGDGKSYQFRVRNKKSLSYSYIFPFETSGDWQTIEIRLKDMYPSFRGRRLDLPNFNHDQIEEITFLIGNKKAGRFELIIDKVFLKHQN